ncbi:MAG: addiction module protein [Fluviicola sp.]|nr:addiction module protein [Fluviicola sp.]
MTHTFHIDGSSEKAQALLEFLRTLEFVNEDKSDFVLTDAHLEILNERRQNHLSGKSKSYTLEEVMNSLGNR